MGNWPALGWLSSVWEHLRECVKFSLDGPLVLLTASQVQELLLPRKRGVLPDVVPKRRELV